MFLTAENYRRIAEEISKMGIKDTSFESTVELNKEDLIPIIQDSSNKNTTVGDLLSYFETIVSNNINVSYVYKKYRISLKDAIELVPEKARKTGIVISFLSDDEQWAMYQFNSDSIEDWGNTSCWVSIYANISKFKGFFESEELLEENVSRPTVGDYTYVGKDMEHSILYMCVENGVWNNTMTPAYDFANLYESVCSMDFDDLEHSIDEKYSDRSEKDALGRIIHFTYVTRDGLSSYVLEKIRNAIEKVELPEGSVSLQHLSKSLADYIGSDGNVTNMPDEEDLTVVPVNGAEVIKLKDKPYNPAAFSGLGRKYIRKNMVDGVNVLEPYMIAEPNTIYIIQYDYCLNGNTITIPENSTLQFEGGTINGGKIILDNTKVRGVFSEEEIGINIEIEGTYFKGQSMFDTAADRPKWWNGEGWITLSANSFTDELKDKLDKLPDNTSLENKLSQKVDGTDLNIVIAELNKSIDSKASSDDIDNAVSTLDEKIDQKVNKDVFEERIDGIAKNVDQKINGSEVHDLFDVVNENLKYKLNISDFDTRISEVNEDIKDKVSKEELNETVVSINNNLRSKASKTELEDKALELSSAIDLKVSKGEFTNTISGINYSMSLLNTKIEGIKGDVDDKVTNQELFDKLSGLETRFNGKLDKDKLSSLLDLDLRFNTKVDAKDYNSNLSIINTNISTVDSKVDIVNDKLNNKVDKVDWTTKIAEFNEKVNTRATKSELLDTMTEVNSELGKKVTKTEFNSKVTLIDSNIGSVDLKVDAVNDSVNDKVDKSELENKIQEVESKFTSVNTRFDTVTSKFALIDSKIATIEQTIAKDNANGGNMEM